MFYFGSYFVCCIFIFTKFQSVALNDCKIFKQLKNLNITQPYCEELSLCMQEKIDRNSYALYWEKLNKNVSKVKATCTL